MTLVDTPDGALMLGTYGWAFISPTRKLYYNLTVTFVPAAVALLVGAIEIFGLIGGRFRLHGLIRRTIEVVSDHVGGIGLGVISLFALAWLLAASTYRVGSIGLAPIAVPRGRKAEGWAARGLPHRS